MAWHALLFWAPNLLVSNWRSKKNGFSVLVWLLAMCRDNLSAEIVRLVSVKQVENFFSSIYKKPKYGKNKNIVHIKKHDQLKPNKQIKKSVNLQYKI